MTARRILIIVGSLLGLCVVLSVVGWGALYLTRPTEETGPVVIIKEPSNKAQVNTNEITLVRGLATDPIGVVGVELWVDGQLEASARSQLEKGSNPFPVVEGWEPETPGQHTLTVRAYNSDGASNHATVRVEALDVPRAAPTPVSHQVQEGDTLETIATGYLVSVEDIVEQNPGLEEPLLPGDSVVIPLPSPEDEDPPPIEERPAETVAEEEFPDGGPWELYPEDGPPDSIESIELSPWLSIISRMPFLRIVPPEPMETALEVEAEFLEVDRTYDGVYCYVSLASSDTERLPAEGDLESLGERRWGIQEQMGPDNRRMVSIPVAEGGLDVWVNCLGYVRSEEGGEISDLGSLEASHFTEEWDGRLIEQSVTGPDGWFRVGYRVWRVGETPEEEVYPIEWLGPPTNLQETAILDSWGFHRGFHLDYPTGGEELVDGFLLYRNGAQLPYGRPYHPSPAADPEYTTWFAEIRERDLFPSCPTIYEFYMVAYREDDELGHRESAPSNSVFIEGDPVPCYQSKMVRVTFEQLETGCLDLDDYIVQRLCTRGCGGLRACCDCNHDPRDWPIPYGDVWVNGEKAPPGLWQDFDSSSVYDVGRFLHPGDLLLGPLDDLTITMKLWDPDMGSRADLFCPGEYTIGHWELDELAKSPPGQRNRTYDPEFSNHNGTCWLKFTLEVLAEAVPPTPVEAVPVEP